MRSITVFLLAAITCALSSHIQTTLSSALPTTQKRIGKDPKAVAWYFAVACEEGDLDLAESLFAGDPKLIDYVKAIVKAKEAERRLRKSIAEKFDATAAAGVSTRQSGVQLTIAGTPGSLSDWAAMATVTEDGDVARAAVGSEPETRLFWLRRIDGEWRIVWIPQTSFGVPAIDAATTISLQVTEEVSAGRFTQPYEVPERISGLFNDWGHREGKASLERSLKEDRSSPTSAPPVFGR